MALSAVVAVARSVAGLLATSVFVLYLTALLGSSTEALTLGLLLRGIDPFRGLTLSEALAIAIAKSAALVLCAFLGAAVIGIVSGIGYALSASSAVRTLCWAVGMVGASLPSFFWTMFLQLAVVMIFIGSGVRLLPTSGFGLDEHLVLPALALATRPASYIFRTTATALDLSLHADYVRTAQAKGLGRSVVAFRHVLPNAAPAIISGLGLAAQMTLSSLLIVEYVFSWHGAGFAFIHSLANGRTELASLFGVAFAAALAGLALATDNVARVAKRRG